jgi:hypothetical protein
MMGVSMSLFGLGDLRALEEGTSVLLKSKLADRGQIRGRVDSTVVLDMFVAAGSFAAVGIAGFGSVEFGLDSGEIHSVKGVEHRNHSVAQGRKLCPFPSRLLELPTLRPPFWW